MQTIPGLKWFDSKQNAMNGQAVLFWFSWSICEYCWLTTCWNDTCTAFLTVQESQASLLQMVFFCECVCAMQLKLDKSTKTYTQNDRATEMLVEFFLLFNGVHDITNKTSNRT